MNRVVKIVLGVLAVVVIAAGSFYGGTVLGKNQAQAAMPAPGEGQGMPGAPGQVGTDSGQATGRQGGMLFGQIQAISDGVLTIKDEGADW